MVADEGGEILIGLETLIAWGIIPECFPLPMALADRVGASRDMAHCFVRAVKETEHRSEKLLDIREHVGSWVTSKMWMIFSLQRKTSGSLMQG